MPTTHLLYLHGFRSSPQSFKARYLANIIAQRHPQVQWWCPQLPASPAQAMAQVLAGVADWPSRSMAVVGSSLGGYYASYVAQRKGCKSVLLNPAVAPDETLAQYIDSHQPLWHQPANAQEEAIFFRAEYIDELRALSVRALPQGAQSWAFFAPAMRCSIGARWCSATPRRSSASCRAGTMPSVTLPPWCPRC